jgi:ribulose 1,5-bisphosphate synthetase/thiazole synthase
MCTPALGQSSAQTTDLVVYGATASGVMTAYSAARQGLHVMLIEPGTHLGGMVTGGLSATPSSVGMRVTSM